MSNYVKGGVLVEWTPRSDLVSGYSLYRSTEEFSSINGMTPIASFDINTTRYVDYDVFEDTEYFYGIVTNYLGMEVLGHVGKVFTGSRTPHLYLIGGEESGVSTITGYDVNGNMTLEAPAESPPVLRVLGSDHRDQIYVFKREGTVEVYDYSNATLIRTIVPDVAVPVLSFDDAQENFYQVSGTVIRKYDRDLTRILWEYDNDTNINNYRLLPNGNITLYSSTTPRKFTYIDASTGEMLEEFEHSGNLIDWRNNGDAIVIDTSVTYGHIFRLIGLSGNVIRSSASQHNTTYPTYDRVNDRIVFRYRASSSAHLGTLRIINGSTFGVIGTRVLYSSATTSIGIRSIVTDHHGKVYVRYQNNTSNSSSYVVYNLNYSSGAIWTRSARNASVSFRGRGGVGLLEATRPLGRFRIYNPNSNASTTYTVPNALVNGERAFTSSRDRRTMFVLHNDGSVYVWRGYTSGFIRIIAAPDYIQSTISTITTTSDGNISVGRQTTNMIEKIDKMSGSVLWSYRITDVHQPIYDIDKDENIYYTSRYSNASTTLTNRLVKLDNQQRILWTNTTTDIANNAFNKVIATPDGKVLLVRSGTLVKINPSTGAIVHSISLPSGFTTTYDFWYRNNFLILMNTTNPRRICKINTGSSPTSTMSTSPVWDVTLTMGGNVNTPSVVEDSEGHIFVLSGNLYLHKLTSTGTTLWTNTPNKQLYNLTIDENDIMYALGGDHTLNFIDKEGNIFHEVSLPTNNGTAGRYGYGMVPFPGHYYLRLAS